MRAAALIRWIHRARMSRFLLPPVPGGGLGDVDRLLPARPRLRGRGLRRLGLAVGAGGLHAAAHRGAPGHGPPDPRAAGVY